MTNKDLITSLLENIRADIITDLKAKDISDGDLGMEVAANNEDGELSGNHYWYYLVHGRRPGKQPPPDSIKAWIEKKGIRVRDITVESLVYLIGRKIGLVGTDIYTGKRPGLALEQITKHNQEQFAGELRDKYLMEFKEAFSKDLKEIFA